MGRPSLADCRCKVTTPRRASRRRLACFRTRVSHALSPAHYARGNRRTHRKNRAGDRRASTPSAAFDPPVQPQPLWGCPESVPPCRPHKASSPHGGDGRPCCPVRQPTHQIGLLRLPLWGCLSLALGGRIREGGRHRWLVTPYGEWGAAWSVVGRSAYMRPLKGVGTHPRPRARRGVCSMPIDVFRPSKVC